jgi:hypothetical protein
MQDKVCMQDMKDSSNASMSEQALLLLLLHHHFYHLS